MIAHHFNTYVFNLNGDMKLIKQAGRTFKGKSDIDDADGFKHNFAPPGNTSALAS